MTIADRAIWSCSLALNLCCYPTAQVRSQWNSLNGGVSQQVRAFALPPDSSRLLVAGGFPYVNENDLRVNNIAWWDGNSWSIEGLGNGNGDTSMTGNPTPVLSILAHTDTIFVSSLGTPWHYDPALERAAILVDDEWLPCGTPENWFHFLEVNGRIFNGGRSDTLYGQYMPMVNEWVDGAWQPLTGSPFDNTGTIYDVAYWNAGYYFVGSFLAGTARSAIRFDGVSEWSDLANGIGGSFTSTVCGYGDSLYAGGFLLPGPNVVSRHIQIWDGTQWLPFFDEVTVSGKVTDIQEYEGELYIAGGFQFGSDTTQYGLIRYDGHQICALGGYMFNGGQPFAFFQHQLYMAKGYVDEPVGEYIGYLDLATVVPDTCVVVTPSSIGPEQMAAQEQLRVHPNPASDVLHISLPNGTLVGKRLSMVDAIGHLVFEARSTTATVEIPLYDLAAGIYAVHVVGADGAYSTRVIVQR